MKLEQIIQSGQRGDGFFTLMPVFYPAVSVQMERKERKSPSSDTLYEVVSLESETEREKRKTTASPGVLSTGPGTMVPSPPEDDEEEGEWMLPHFITFPFRLFSSWGFNFSNPLAAKA